MFRASTSRQYSRSKQANDFLKKYQNGLQLDPYDLVFVTADNVQLQRPKDHSYSHWFTLMYMQYPGKVLDQWEALRASRDRQDWGLLLAEKTSDEILNDVFRPRMEEFARLGNSLFTQWSVTLQWMHNLPTLKECRESKLSNDYNWEKGLPLLYRFQEPTTYLSLQQHSKLFATAAVFNLNLIKNQQRIIKRFSSATTQNQGCLVSRTLDRSDH
jgi:hypothetical protein